MEHPHMLGKSANRNINRFLLFCGFDLKIQTNLVLIINWWEDNNGDNNLNNELNIN